MSHGFRWTAHAWVLVLFSCAFGASGSAQELKDVLKRTPDTEHGAQVFRHCVACHGADGLGDPDGSVPMIAGQHEQVIAKQLIDYRHAKRWDIRMEKIADRHVFQSTQDIADVAAYASRLARSKKGSPGNGEYLERGEETYAERCAGCHGAKGEGKPERFAPRLAGQHYEYLLRQLYDAVDGRRPNMSRAHIKLLKAFVMEDFEGMADYLSRLEAQ